MGIIIKPIVTEKMTAMGWFPCGPEGRQVANQESRRSDVQRDGRIGKHDELSWQKQKPLHQDRSHLG